MRLEAREHPRAGAAAAAAVFFCRWVSWDKAEEGEGDGKGIERREERERSGDKGMEDKKKERGETRRQVKSRQGNGKETIVRTRYERGGKRR